MGLVEEKTGMLYYINAEHPWVVLYRDEKASFIEDSLSLRKIGMLVTDGHLMIKTFHLQPEDSILIGSDGRDDVLLSVNEKGERVINEDEFFFLRHVEKGKGDLQKITENIKAYGELTDDYTLVKITYKPVVDQMISYEDNSKFYELVSEAETSIHFKEIDKACQILKDALELKPNDLNTLHKLIHIMFQTKKYKEMVPYCERYMELEPIDTEVMFILSSTYKLNGELENAIDTGESLRLREPNNVKNLINLADTYRLIKNFPRAFKMLEMALEKEPDNEKALKLKAILQAS
jgi:tetratricopeptide (TPR) repeat protein